MNFLVHYDPKAEKFLGKLTKFIARRIIIKMRQVAETGRGIESLKESEFGFKIRVGEYRVLLDIAYDTHTLWVRRIEHRSKVYKR